MRRLGITIVVIALSVAGVTTAAHAAGTFGLRTPVAVTPTHGTPTTTFTVRFKTPFATGSSRGLRSWEIASVADQGQSSPSCLGIMAVQLRPAVAHHRVNVSLRSPTKPWCTGDYSGTITLYRSIVCNPGPPSQRTACPDIAFAPEPIGHFRFRVSRAAS
jgi:hypothetical protein